MTKIDAAKRLGESFETFAMSNCDTEDTGLPNSIFIWFEIGGGDMNHGPRIKVSNVRGKFRKDDCFSFSIPTKGSEKPRVVGGEAKHFTTKELKALTTWVTLNRLALIQIWNADDISDRRARELLKKL